ncbi:OmpA family protein [Cyclobacterium qasimii]|nr:OmpA family protein [Cyclobacterium qasimii]
MITLHRLIITCLFLYLGMSYGNSLQAQSMTSSMDTLYHWVNSNQSIEGKVLNLPHLQYETDNHLLTANSKMSIDTLVMGLKEVENIAIAIEGYTDDVGDEDYNLELSVKRAESVYNYLIQKEIVADRLKFDGFGMSNPIVPNTSAENRAINRRVEIVLKLRDDIQVEQVSQTIYLNSGKIIPVKEYTIEETYLSYLQYGSTSKRTEPLENVNYIVGTDGTRKYDNQMAGFNDKASEPVPEPVPTPKAPVKTNDYAGFYLGIGSRSTNLEESLMWLNYVDESPSMDSFLGEKTIKEQEYGISFDFGIQTGNFNGYHYEIGGSGITGTVNFLAFHTAYGHNFSLGASNKIIFRPVLGIEFGRAKAPLGDIINNDVYIRVNDSDFYSEDVSIKVISNQGTVKPRFDFVFPFQKAEGYSMLTITGGYSYNIYSNNPMIKFSGTDENNESISAKENLDESNIDFRLNEIRSTDKLPFDLNGPFIGLAFQF